MIIVKEVCEMIIDEELIEEIEKITYSKYKKYRFYNDEGKVMVPGEDIVAMLENLAYEYKCFEEKYDDMIQGRNDNYRQLTPSEIYG